LKRLLTAYVSQRPIIVYLLIVALVVNYIINIIFAIIFYKYFVPLITAPRQIDYITIGLILVIGMVTNYRFCLIFFGKMFPKPRI
jgi:TctA family transporter